jgi:uncharacterized membrane protein YgcG
MSSFRLVFIILFCSIVGSVHAEYFVIKDYKIDMRINGSDAVIEVFEELTVDFNEPRHGLFRFIPRQYRIDGKVVDVKIYDVDVEGFNSKTYNEGSNFVIKIGDKDLYVEGRQVYKIRYKVKKAFLLQEKHTEFYYNLVGTGWPVDIEKVKYTITLDKSLPMSEDEYHVYTGAAGSKDSSATISYYVNKFEGETTKVLYPNEGLTVAIKLPVDYVKRPTEWEVFWEKYGMGGLGGIFFTIITGLFYRTWKRYGKEYPIVKMVHFTPPKDLNPAEAGVIIDEKADNIDILSLLPYWAHNGHLLIKKIPKSWGKDDHELTKIKDLPVNAAPYEKIVFDGLFDNGDMVLVSDLKNKFHENISAAKVSLKSHISNMGIYYPVSIKMQIYSAVISFVLMVLAVVVGIVFGSFALGLGFGMSGVIGFFFSNYMLKKNELGVRLYQEVLGFKMFIKAAEKDKIERMLKDDPEYFEKTLPYAMIFGYAKSWSKKFDGLLLEPPKWYVTPGGYYGHGGFYPSEFGSSFESSINDIQSVFTSMPESSGSGGSFGGGGSVGGGFGGGGGGSW